MSISSISSAQTSYQPSSSQSAFRQDFGQLVSALNSGNLSGAQQAFATLSNLQRNGQGPGSNPNSPFSQALSQIGQALQNGDLGGAQQALASLQQARGGHHGHHHGAGESAPPPDTTATPSTSTTSATTPTDNLVNLVA